MYMGSTKLRDAKTKPLLTKVNMSQSKCVANTSSSTLNRCLRTANVDPNPSYAKGFLFKLKRSNAMEGLRGMEDTLVETFGITKE
jgi:hypothetical protein